MDSNPNPTNPYQPPQSEIIVPGTGGQLASPWIRLGAAIVDGVVLLPINFIVAFIILKMMPNIVGMILATTCGYAAFFAVNLNLLKNGQTVGKKFLKLQIQRSSDGTILPLQELLLKRFGVFYGVAFVSTVLRFVSPTLGGLVGLVLLVDALCIFRPGRNTLHDDVAGSKVVCLPA